MEKFPGNAQTFLSADSVKETEQTFLYPSEYLNTINLSGVPPHRLLLKEGSPIMLLRNLNPFLGLCNGTQLKCIAFHQHLIEAEIVTGIKTGEKVFLPRINIEPSDTELPFVLRRRQFPVRPSFAMTINKSQGQTLKKVAIYLEENVFSHGQLYVAMSRVSSMTDIVILTKQDKFGNFVTRNVVYPQVL